jgi:uncharacterized protein YjbI with pentapeptide repeats
MPPVIKADLSNANLNQANLAGAGMVAAKLQGANLTKVCLHPGVRLLRH